ncbi:MAG: hypothetical protein B7Z26_00060 [Asticcacaulis sp. 32-58-5]|nr:MAG: hypothetical protein B7Z26_00060 [Asticcacaulis sp. 32-58-5]
MACFLANPQNLTMPLSAPDIWMLMALIFGAAAIYSSVGHAGASGYIAAMALFEVDSTTMKPTALILNILVAGFAFYRLYGAGLVNIRALMPLIMTSVPMAFVGGMIQLPSHWYRSLLGLVLAFAALRLAIKPREPKAAQSRKAAPAPPLAPAAVTGGVIGALSGLTGTGGGIFLSPVLIFFGWASARQSAGLTAPFILVNSIAGLAGSYKTLECLPALVPYLIVPALLGAALGSHIGIRWLAPVLLQRLLAAVLCIAAAKFVLLEHDSF